MCRSNFRGRRSAGATRASCFVSNLSWTRAAAVASTQSRRGRGGLAQRRDRELRREPADRRGRSPRRGTRNRNLTGTARDAGESVKRSGRPAFAGFLVVEDFRVLLVVHRGNGPEGLQVSKEAHNE